MKSYHKSDDTYKTIGEVTKELGLIDKKTGHLQTHTLRFWETQIKKIKPLIRAGKRRYYSKRNFQIIKLIKFLLKEQGLTINGVKKRTIWFVFWNKTNFYRSFFSHYLNSLIL